MRSVLRLVWAVINGTRLRLELGSRSIDLEVCAMIFLTAGGTTKRDCMMLSLTSLMSGSEFGYVGLGILGCPFPSLRVNFVLLMDPNQINDL